jgi:hypothetical protein
VIVGGFRKGEVALSDLTCGGFIPPPTLFRVGHHAERDDYTRDGRGSNSPADSIIGARAGERQEKMNGGAKRGAMFISEVTRAPADASGENFGDFSWGENDGFRSARLRIRLSRFRRGFARGLTTGEHSAA